MEELAAKWIELKAKEKALSSERKEIEEELIKIMRIEEDKEGTVKKDTDRYLIKAQCKLTRKVDGDKAQEIAMEEGLTEYLSTLFRWKPEINIKSWKACSPEITKKLSLAITAKPARPYFTIDIKGY